jgi:PLP dependent protein
MHQWGKYMTITGNLSKLKEEVDEHVKIVVVSKTRSIEEMMEAYKAGYKVFGENKAQEITRKQKLMPPDVEWHFIGHLQSNKVRMITPFVHMIHSVDSFRLLQEIDKEASRNNRVIRCLLQFYIATEETKFGLDIEEAVGLLEKRKTAFMQNTILSGVMGMASFTNDQEVIRKEFRVLKNYFMQLKNQYFKDKEEFKEISMGMSGDYLLALSEGSTILRLGTVIFGERDYT